MQVARVVHPTDYMTVVRKRKPFSAKCLVFVSFIESLKNKKAPVAYRSFSISAGGFCFLHLRIRGQAVGLGTSSYGAPVPHLLVKSFTFAVLRKKKIK